MAQSNAAFKIWNRLEARPRSNNFERSLRAEIRDPLWMLSRQWQMGEFQSEDAGSVIFAQAKLGFTQIDHFAPKELGATEIDATMPMETLVERVPINLGSKSYEQLSLRVEMGKHWLKLLEGHFSGTELSLMKQFFLDHEDLKIEIPVKSDELARFYSDQKLWAFMAAISRGKALNGGAIYQHINAAPGNTASDYLLSMGHPPPNMVAGVNAVGDDFVAWFERVYSQPKDDQSAWDEQHLEYRFDTSAPEENGDTSVLRSQAYHHGKLDWYAFDHDKASAPVNTTLVPGQVNNSIPQEEQFTFIPTEVQFPGMPNARWWEMEDQNVDLSGIQADTSELGKILLAEFALNYSNDWMIFPYEVPVGSLSEVKEIVVRDVFGQKTKIEAASTDADNNWMGWGMFYLKNRNAAQEEDLRLFVPPVLSESLESEPLEQVLFVRDELANQVWAIEQVIPHALGEGVGGHEQAMKMQTYFEGIVSGSSPLTLLQNDATIKYQIATSIPENWIPFIPVRKGSFDGREIQLQRAGHAAISEWTGLWQGAPKDQYLEAWF